MSTYDQLPAIRPDTPLTTLEQPKHPARPISQKECLAFLNKQEAVDIRLIEFDIISLKKVIYRITRLRTLQRETPTDERNEKIIAIMRALITSIPRYNEFLNAEKQKGGLSPQCKKLEKEVNELKQLALEYIQTETSGGSNTSAAKRQDLPVYVPRIPSRRPPSSERNTEHITEPPAGAQPPTEEESAIPEDPRRTSSPSYPDLWG